MPYKYKEDYNANRRKYRKQKSLEGFCHRCYRPLLEDSTRKECECCIDARIKMQFLWRNFNGDN